MELVRLVKELRHWRASVRARAARQLGALGLEEACAPLTAAAADRRAAVRRAALEALWQIDPNHFAEAAVRLATAVPPSSLFDDLEAVVQAVTAGNYRRPT